MAITAKALREKREALHAKMIEHRDKITADSYKFDEADERTWTTMHDEEKQLDSQIRQIEQGDDILKNRDKAGEERDKLRSDFKKKSRQVDPTKPLTAEERNLAIGGALIRFLCGVTAGISTQTREVVERAKAQGLFRSGSKGLDIRLGWTPSETRTKQRALAFGAHSGNVGTLGPEGFISTLEQNMLTHGPMLQVASIMYTSDGRNMQAPYVDDTSNEGDIVAEAAAVSTAADPTFSELVWGAYKVRSKKVIYSSEAAEDSVFDLPNIIAGLLGERIGRGMNRYCTTGTGSGQHTGVVIDSALGKTAASATAFTADELIDLEHSVDPAYRLNAAYMMHDTILAYVRKLKYSGSGEYIFKFEKGTNGTINGRDVQVNNHMATALTTGQKLVLFGDFSKYIVRIVNTIRVRRNLELHSDNDQESLQAFLRSDAKLNQHGTSPLKRLQLA
jgi:HK97 family phage major capsid protein